MSIRSNVDARRLDAVIVIERATESQDGMGGAVKTWAPLVTCPAAADATLARNAEPFLADQERGPSAMTFWIRADIISRFGVTLTDRVSWNGRVYDIRDMPDQQLRGRLAALIATTGLNQG